jgi:2Fe-2S ferredoxin
MKIKFLPQNIEVEANSDKSLLQIANENQIEIHSVCKGVPSCAECRVRVVKGDRNVLPPNKAELALIGTNYFIDGRRLSCQVHCFGDVTIDLTEQVERQDNQVKKIRGFRSNKQVESKAVNDMMLLNEHETHSKDNNPSSDSKSEESQAAAGTRESQGETKQQPQQKKHQHQHNRQNQQHQQRNNNQQPKKQGQPRSQDQNQGPRNNNRNQQNPNQNQNQNQNRPKK